MGFTTRSITHWRIGALGLALVLALACATAQASAATVSLGSTACVIHDQATTSAGVPVSASTTFLKAPLAVDTVPAKAKPSKPVTFNFSGFTAGAPIYGHYLYHGKVQVTKRFATAAAPCGTGSARSTIFPHGAKHSSYTLQIDDSRTYSKSASPQVRSTVYKTSF